MRISYRNNKVNLPDFLIVGAAKAGTTSLYEYLLQNRALFLSKIKEPNYFLFADNDREYFFPKLKRTEKLSSMNYIIDTKDYIDIFKKAKDDQICGEASTIYLYKAEDTIKNIKKMYGKDYKKLKIIIILRNPLDRAWSHYMMHKTVNETEGFSFHKSIDKDVIQKRLENKYFYGYDYINFGMYYKQVKEYMNTFSDVKIILFDDFIKNKETVIQDVFSFLKVSNTAVKEIKKKNVSGKPKNVFAAGIIFVIDKTRWIFKYVDRNKRRNAWLFINRFLFKKVKMPNKYRPLLGRIYKDDIAKLSKLINKDLTKWY